MTEGSYGSHRSHDSASRRGVRLGVDVGSVRVGLAASDPDGLLAAPVETIARDTTGGSDQARIAVVRGERDAIEVVVGLPRSLSGEEGAAAATARSYAVRLATLLAPIPVRLVDERLTTVDAHRRLRESGIAGRAQRAVIDQAAAVLILQSALDAERASGRAPGELVQPDQHHDAAGASRRRRKKAHAGRTVEPVLGSGDFVGDSTGRDDGVTKTEEPRR